MIRRIHVISVLAIIMSVVGCVSHRENESATPIPQSQLTEVMEAVDRFWSAAAANDAPAMRQETTGAKALSWVERWRQAYPTFFRETVQNLKLVAAYTPPDQPDAIEVLIEVPWVSCPPPAHEGDRDRYHIRLLPRDSSWRVADVWKDIC